MDRYADDLAELIEKLDLYNLVLVGQAEARSRTTSAVMAPSASPK
jgi:hypothetical protein